MQPLTLSNWDLEHGWYAVWLFTHRFPLPEIAFMMEADQKFIARYVLAFEQNPALKAEILQQAQTRYPAMFMPRVVEISY
jgi:hypothetical protein